MIFWKNPRLVSACLLGINCRWDGKNNLNKKILRFCRKETYLPICPEILGGLSIPRVPCEIVKGEGKDVLGRKAKVFGENGKDYTKYFIKGAKEVLKIAKIFKIKEAILKEKSPSCGKGKIHNGTFSGKLKKGDGVLVALLKKNKIKVKIENEI